VIAVIFEVVPVYGRRSAYLDLAAQLHARLERIDGFLSIERFESLKMPGKILSLSFWRDEEAIAKWRNGPEHRAAQHAGRNGTFADYRLRIATVIRDYGMSERDEAPEDSRAYHENAERTPTAPRVFLDAQRSLQHFDFGRLKWRRRSKGRT